MAKVVVTPAAKKDMLEIKRYIAVQLQNPSAARRVLPHITGKLRSLTEFPERGMPVSAVLEQPTDYRYLICGNYLAFYRVEAGNVVVDRVLYGRSDYISTLFSLDAETLD